MILTINNKAGKIVIEHESNGEIQDSEKAFEEMTEHLSPEVARYVAVKLTYEAEDGRHSEDIALFMWRGSKTKGKDKLVYAATAGAVKSALAHKTYHEYDNKGELTHADLIARCQK